jgi:hypothetical protein
VVEWSFVTLFGRVRSMMNTAQITERKKKQLWATCASIATEIANIVLLWKQPFTERFMARILRTKIILEFLENLALSIIQQV